MATHNIHVSEELFADLRVKAEAAGKSVDALAEEALRKGLEAQSWQDLLAYGKKNGESSGYTEDDVPGLVKDWRREQRER